MLTYHLYCIFMYSASLIYLFLLMHQTSSVPCYHPLLSKHTLVSTSLQLTKKIRDGSPAAGALQYRSFLFYHIPFANEKLPVNKIYKVTSDLCLRLSAASPCTQHLAVTHCPCAVITPFRLTPNSQAQLDATFGFVFAHFLITSSG